MELLRSPRGLGWLVGLTLVGAVGLAVLMAANLTFFEGTRKLVYDEPTGKTVLLVQQLRAGELQANALPSSVQRDLVRYSLIDDPALGDRSWMPRPLAAAVPRALRDEVQRALLAGTTEQVEAALVLAEQSESGAARGVIVEALERAQARREPAMLARLERALARLPATPSSD